MAALSIMLLLSLALVLSTATFTLQDVFGTAFGRWQEISAIRAEDKGTDGGHVEVGCL